LGTNFILKAGFCKVELVLNSTSWYGIRVYLSTVLMSLALESLSDHS